MPRMLIFFHNINTLIDAYQLVTVRSNQQLGEFLSQCVMFHLITEPSIKKKVIDDLGNPDGIIRCVFCSSSLSMGINLARIEYVLHYGPPSTVEAFLQETGRASREVGASGHSILLTFPRMAAGRKLDSTMKHYITDTTCLRDTLLSNFNSRKPVNQPKCCSLCEPCVSCEILDLIRQQYDSDITDSFDDSESVGSAGNVSDLEMPDI